MSLFILGQVLSFAAKAKAAKQAKLEAEQKAQDAETKAKETKVIALEQHNDLVKDSIKVNASNLASFAFQGRDVSDRSVKAFLDNYSQEVSTDLNRFDSSAIIRRRRLITLADRTRQAGKVKSSSIMLGAVSSFATNIATNSDILDI